MSRVAPCGDPDFIAGQRADQAALVAVAVDAIRQEIPFYRALDAGGLAETAGAITVAIETVLACWEEGRTPSSADVADFPRTGVVKGAVMRPLPVVLRGWRVGTRAVHETVLERGAGRLSAPDVASLSLIVLAWIDRISDVVTDAYSVAAHASGSGGADVRAQLVLSLITGSYSSTDMLRRRASSAGVALPEPGLVVIGTATGPDPPLVDRIVRFLDRLGIEPGRRLDLDLDDRAVFILPPVEHGNLADAVADATLRAVCIGTVDVAEVTAAYRTALRATGYLASVESERSRLFSEYETRLAALLSHQLGGSAEVEAVIEALGARDEELRKTMLAYYETGSAESAAHRIGVHPQTVRYRLRGIRERTGLDPTVGWSRFAIELAVRTDAARPGQR